MLGPISSQHIARQSVATDGRSCIRVFGEWLQGRHVPADGSLVHTMGKRLWAVDAEGEQKVRGAEKRTEGTMRIGLG